MTAKQTEYGAADVRRALKAWAAARAESPDVQRLPSYREEKTQLEQLLEQHGSSIFGYIAETLKARALDSRIYLRDISAELAIFLQKAHPNRAFVDSLRDWCRTNFGDRIRVEGDPHSTGLYLDIA